MRGEFNLSDYIERVYVIHMSDKTERMEVLEQELNKIIFKDGKSLKEHVEIVEAVNGRQLKREDDDITDQYYSVKYHNDICTHKVWNDVSDLDARLISVSEPEKGISHSHVKVWKQFLDSGAETAFIMEDDVRFKDGFLSSLKASVEEAGNDFDIIYLSLLPSGDSFEAKSHSEHLLRAKKGVWWLSGYIISRKYAQKLISRLPVVGPVDLWINYQFDESNVFINPKRPVMQRQELTSSNEYSYWHYVRQFSNVFRGKRKKDI